MKQRIKMIVKKQKTTFTVAFIALLILAGISATTFGMAKEQTDSESVDTIMNETASQEKTNMSEQKKDVESSGKSEKILTDELDWSSSPDKKLTSIKISLPTNAEGKQEYIIFGGEIQEKLTELVQKLNPMAEEADKLKKQWLQEKELGFEVHYEGNVWTAYSDGYFQLYSADLKLVQNVKLSEFVCGLLKDYADYEPIEPSSIRNITSATMAYTPEETEKYSQTIYDQKLLKKIGKWISEAEYVRGGSGCPFGEAKLILTMEKNKTVTLDMATDSCMIFGINGVYYKYYAKSPGKESKEYYSELWSFFDELPNFQYRESKEN